MTFNLDVFLSFFSALLVAFSTAELQEGYCPLNGVTTEDPGLYKCLAVSTDALSWFDAIYTCEIHGGSLVKIETDEQLQYVNNIIHDSDYHWIGLNDIRKENQFMWPDQTINDPVIFWTVKQPNGHRDQNCVAIKDGTWQDKECRTTYKYVCQFSLDTPPEPRIIIPMAAQLPSNRDKMIKPDTWNNRALMVFLTVEDESLCVLYCLYTNECVRVAYRTNKGGTNCLLYRSADGSDAPLWDWRVYEVESNTTAMNAESVSKENLY